MACRCVVHFAKAVQDPGNSKTFALRLHELFNIDGNFAEIKHGSGGNFFVHYKGTAMPQAHQDIVAKLSGALKSTKRSDYHFHDGSVQEYQEPSQEDERLPTAQEKPACAPPVMRAA